MEPTQMKLNSNFENGTQIRLNEVNLEVNFSVCCHLYHKNDIFPFIII